MCLYGPHIEGRRQFCSGRLRNCVFHRWQCTDAKTWSRLVHSSGILTSRFYKHARGGPHDTDVANSGLGWWAVAEAPASLSLPNVITDSFTESSWLMKGGHQGTGRWMSRGFVNSCAYLCCVMSRRRNNPCMTTGTVSWAGWSPGLLPTQKCLSCVGSADGVRVTGPSLVKPCGKTCKRSCKIGKKLKLKVSVWRWSALYFSTCQQHAEARDRKVYI